MTKISFMTFACPDCSFDQVLSLAVNHGYQGIEFRCDADHRHGVEVAASVRQRAEFRRKLADAGVDPCCLATSLQFASEDAIAEAPALIELAVSLGCHGLRVFCGPLPEGLSLENAIPRVARNLRRVAERAFHARVGLWLETHDSICRGRDAGRIVRLADHPAVGINWDNMHPARNGEALGVTWQAIGPYIRHTHLHDAVAEPGAPIITPFGQGDLPMQRMYDLLRFSGYEGYFSGEWFGIQMGADADASLLAFKAGLQALEQGWQEGG
jgi:sugar phosphate isomerase/epimerase